VAQQCHHSGKHWSQGGGYTGSPLVRLNALSSLPWTCAEVTAIYPEELLESGLSKSKCKAAF
jgi:hypothetical protein